MDEIIIQSKVEFNHRDVQPDIEEDDKDYN